jgi:hypothetical protein
MLREQRQRDLAQELRDAEHHGKGLR